MTLNETEEIGRECEKAARFGGREAADLLAKAAEAIEWLREQLEDAERWSGFGDL